MRNTTKAPEVRQPNNLTGAEAYSVSSKRFRNLSNQDDFIRSDMLEQAMIDDEEDVLSALNYAVETGTRLPAIENRLVHERAVHLKEYMRACIPTHTRLENLEADVVSSSNALTVLVYMFHTCVGVWPEGAKRVGEILSGEYSLKDLQEFKIHVEAMKLEKGEEMNAEECAFCSTTYQLMTDAFAKHGVTLDPCGTKKEEEEEEEEEDAGEVPLGILKAQAAEETTPAVTPPDAKPDVSSSTGSV